MSKVVCCLTFAALDAAWPAAWLESLGTISHATLRLTAEVSFLLLTLQVYTHPLTETLLRTRNGIIHTLHTSNSSSSDFPTARPPGGGVCRRHLLIITRASLNRPADDVGGLGVWGWRCALVHSSTAARTGVSLFGSPLYGILSRSCPPIMCTDLTLPNVLQAYGIPNNPLTESNAPKVLSVTFSDCLRTSKSTFLYFTYNTVSEFYLSLVYGSYILYITVRPTRALGNRGVFGLMKRLACST